jgi:hypothetical protein
MAKLKDVFHIVARDNHDLYITRLSSGELQLKEKSANDCEFNVVFETAEKAKSFISKHFNSCDFEVEEIAVLDEERRDFYFRRSNRTLRLLGEWVSEKEAMKIMHAFMKDSEFESYYTRIWDENDNRVYDVGSWSEFFIWGNTPEEVKSV